ncbi:hypothetical protein JCM10213_001564 [Rhodosporidiobolus nylandii]
MVSLEPLTAPLDLLRGTVGHAESPRFASAHSLLSPVADFLEGHTRPLYSFSFSCPTLSLERIVSHSLLAAQVQALLPVSSPGYNGTAGYSWP